MIEQTCIYTFAHLYINTQNINFVVLFTRGPRSTNIPVIMNTSRSYTLIYKWHFPRKGNWVIGRQHWDTGVRD